MPVGGSKKKDRKRSYVNIRFRLRGNRKVYRFLNGLAGANRYLWNHALAQAKQDYEETGKAKTSQFDLYTWYKEHKDTVAPWLSEYSVICTRTGLKDLSDAYKQFFKRQRSFPRFKKKGKSKKTFAVDVSGGSQFTENGYFRLKRGLYAKVIAHHRTRRYSNPVPKSARIFEEHGNWYITVCYEVDAVEHTAERNGIGVDRNVGQVADSTGQIYYLTDVERIEKRIKFLKRRLARCTKGSNTYRKTKHTVARHQRRIANLRKNDLRHIAREITTTSSLVFLEDLKTKGMTASAKGTAEHPGKNVKQKAGLNRSILSTGWGQLESYLGERGIVHKINPAYTSQTCNRCGYVDAGNRISQAVFRCQMCEYLIHADVNAAWNIRASGMASFNGSGAYVRPLIVECKPAIGRRALKEQTELECLGYSCI